jgi:hypothetical protein
MMKMRYIYTTEYYSVKKNEILRVVHGGAHLYSQLHEMQR